MNAEKIHGNNVYVNLDEVVETVYQCRNDVADDEWVKRWLEPLESLPKTQIKTQNSNLTFEKRTMRDCYNCKKYEAEGECIECHYEPKDEPQTERSE